MMKKRNKIFLLFVCTLIFTAFCLPAAVFAEDSAPGSGIVVIRRSKDSGKEIAKRSYGSFDEAWEKIPSLSGLYDITEITMYEDVDLQEEKELAVEYATVSLDLNGHSLIRHTKNDKQVKKGGLFLIKEKSHLIIKDSAPKSAGYNGIKGGVITGGASTSGGGAFTIEDKGKVTIEGGTIYNCSTNEHGGAVMLKGDSSNESEFNMTGGRIYFCKTVGATANSHGGAVYADNGNVNIGNVKIDDCYSEDNGGAIYINSGKLKVDNSILTGNHCQDYGGAVFISGGSLLLKNSRFTTNEAKKDGGAVYVDSDGGARIISCLFSKNKTSGNGGAIYVNDERTFLADTEVTDNTAGGEGGGVYVDSLSDIGVKGLMKIKNNLIKNNKDPDVSDNLKLQDGVASRAYLTSGGLYEGSEIWLSSTGKNVKYAENISSSQTKFFFSDRGTIEYGDTYEREAPMLASVFGDGSHLWISFVIMLVLLAGLTVALVMRKKGEKKV